MTTSKQTFGATLRAHLEKRYDDALPQANMLAKLYNMRSDEKDFISGEVMQAWLDDKIEPTDLQLKTFHAWLGL